MKTPHLEGKRGFIRVCNLVALKFAAFMALVKKEICEKNKAKADEYKQELREKSVTCEICYHKFSNQSARDRHKKAKHGQNRLEAKMKDTSALIVRNVLGKTFPSSITLKSFIVMPLKNMFSLFVKNVRKSLNTRHPLKDI